MKCENVDNVLKVENVKNVDYVEKVENVKNVEIVVNVEKGWLQNAKLKKIQKDKSDLGATWVSQ